MLRGPNRARAQITGTAGPSRRMTYTFRGTMSGWIAGGGTRQDFQETEVCLTLATDTAAIARAGTAQLVSPDRATIAIVGLGLTATVRDPGELGLASGSNGLMLLDLKLVRCLLGVEVPDRSQDLATGFRFEGPAFQDAAELPTDRGDLTITRVLGPVTVQATPSDPRAWTDWGAIGRPSGPRFPAPGVN